MAEVGRIRLGIKATHHASVTSFSQAEFNLNDMVYLNGEYLPAEAAKISVFDRGLLLADAVYEVVPVIKGQLVDKEYFLQRLGYSLGELKLAWPLDATAYVAMLTELIRRNRLQEGSVYTQVTRGVAARQFTFPEATCTPTLLAFTQPHPLLHTTHAEQGIAVATTTDWRWQRRDIKTTNLLAQVLAKQYAATQGAAEVWLVEEGYVTEGGSASAYIVKADTVITRELSTAILPGIRRRTLLELAAANNIDCQLRPFTVAEALTADEAFISSATALITPVIRLDQQPIGSGTPGPFTRQLQQLYRQHLLSQL